MGKIEEAGNSQPKWRIETDGTMWWGSGSSPPDVNLWRPSADTLRTNDSLVVDGGLTVVGTVSASTAMNVGRETFPHISKMEKGWPVIQHE